MPSAVVRRKQGSRDSRLSLSGCIAKTNCGECSNVVINILFAPTIETLYLSAYHGNLMQHMYIHIVLALAMCVWHQTRPCAKTPIPDWQANTLYTRRQKDSH